MTEATLSQLALARVISLASLLLLLLVFYISGPPGRLLAPHPFPDVPLSAEPLWVHLKAAMLKFNPPEETSEQPEGSGCQLPELDPWDPSIRLWVKDWPPPYDKKAGIEDLLFVTMDTLHFNTTWLERLKLDRKDIACNYSYISAWNSRTSELPFEEDVLTLLPNYNSIWTRCVHGLKVLSTMTLFYVPPAISELNQTGDGVAAYSKSNFSRKILGKRYSVTLLIIDSLSQMNIHRSLPKSLAQAEAMGGILMSGHHKIGENSVPNMMGMMTGDKLYWTPGWVTSRNKTPETLPMIIGMFRDWGWSTVYFEDMIHWVGPALKYDVKVANPWTTTYNDVMWYLRGSLAHNNPIKTISDMHLAYKELPSFLHIHLSEYLHDNLNMAKNYDADLAAMLIYLFQEKAVEDTFVLLMGDHGYRMQGFTNLEQGKIENNMPGLIVIPPRDLQAQHPDWVKNLQANAEVLTSHWDIHHMFREILGGAGGAEEVAKVYSHLKVPGASLLSPLAKRSCTAAGIPLEYCSCPSGHRALDPKRVQDIAVAVLKDINIFLQPLWGCRKLRLTNITGAVIKTEGQTVVIEAVLATTIPPVVFRLRLSNRGNASSVSLARSDRYDSTSRCVPKTEMGARPYCICPTKAKLRN